MENLHATSLRNAELKQGRRSLQEEPEDLLTFVARYRDGSVDRFAVDPFTVLRGNYVAVGDARQRQGKGSLKPGEIELVYRDRRLKL